MAGQQGDVLLTQTVNDGDIESVDGQITMTCGLETAVYLSLFNGADWWGDLQETDPDRRHLSETEQLIESIPAVPANLRRIEQAALRDLAMFLNQKIASRVEVTASIPNVDRIELQIIIEARGRRSEFNFVENWECSTNTGGEFEGAGVAPELPPVKPPVPQPPTNLFEWELIPGTTGLNRTYALAVDQNTGDVWTVSDDATTSPTNGGAIRVLRGGALPYETGVAAADNPVWNRVRHMAVHDDTGDLWLGGRNQLFVFRGGTAPAEDAAWLGSDISGLAVDQATGTVFINTSVQSRVSYILNGVISNGQSEVSGWFGNPNRNSQREVAFDPNAARMYVVNVDNNPVLTDVWTRKPYETDSWTKSGDSPYTTQENTVGFDRNYSSGDMLISVFDGDGIMLQKEGETTWRVAGQLPVDNAIITVKYNSLTGEAWCCDVLANQVWRSPGRTDLAKTIDSIGSNTGPFNSAFLGYRSGQYGTMGDTSFGNVTIDSLELVYNTSAPAVSTLQVRILDDTLTQSYITGGIVQGVGTFDNLISFDASGGIAAWTFEATPNTLGIGDWVDGESRTVTLNLV